MRNRTLIASIAFLALAAGGCGGGKSGGNAGPPTAAAGKSTTAAEAKASTRAKFIAAADAVCARADARQEAGFRRYKKENPGSPSSKSWEEKALVAVGLPPIKVEVEELGDLPAPSGDEDTIEAMIESLEEALKTAEADPGALVTEGSGPFGKASRLAREYGFKACSNPL